MNPLTQIKNTQKISAQEVAAGLSDNASWHAKYKDSAYVFAGGLGYDLTEGDLLAVFAQYGEIMDVNLVRDPDTGKSKGFAFLAYEDQRSTVLAVDNLNGARIAGRIVRVDHVASYKRKKEETEEERNAAREERGTCRAFQRGECTRGSACRFSHDEERNSKTGWAPKEEPESSMRWPNNKFPGSHAKAGAGMKAGNGAWKEGAGPSKAAMGPPRPVGPVKDEAPQTSGRGEGGALPWEGGLFSMLADKVDLKNNHSEDRDRKEDRDRREDRRHEKRRKNGTGGRDSDRSRSPKKQKHDSGAENGTHHRVNGAQEGERNRKRGDRDLSDRKTRDQSPDERRQSTDQREGRRGHDGTEGRAGEGAGKRRDERNGHDQRRGSLLDRHHDEDRKGSRRRGDDDSRRERRETSEKDRRER